VALAVVSIFRKQLGIGYDWWRRLHGVLAIVAVGAGVAHILLIGHYLSTPLQRGLWLAYTGVFVALILYIRVVKPWLELRRPYEVVEVRPERAESWTIALRPRGHAGMRFAPGQFAWITLGNSPFSDREHPFSFSGSAEAGDGRLEFTIKERGDFTQSVKHVAPGATAYIDGPFGSLSADRHPDAAGFALIAGGVGITPMMSHLRTFADRAGAGGETRPLVLFYCSNAWDRVIFREEIEALAARLPTLKVVHVLAQGHEGWTGETGFLTAAIMKKHLPADLSRWEAFICGPTPMMDAAENALHEIGMHLGNFHSEQFELV
jgi:predicted ferric reductase